MQHALARHIRGSARPEMGRAFRRILARLPALVAARRARARARPTAKAAARCTPHMPEIVPLYDQLCELAGGGDQAARFLSFYCPPPYLSGC